MSQIEKWNLYIVFNIVGTVININNQNYNTILCLHSKHKTTD